MRLVLSDSVYPANGGDSAILFGMIDAIRRVKPGASFVVVSSYAHEARDPPGCRAISDPLVGIKAPLRLGSPFRQGATWREYRRLVRAVRRGDTGDDYTEALSDADAMISCGGGFLHDYYDVLPRVLGHAVGRAAGLPVAFMAQSIGPFTSRWRRVLVSRDLQAARHVLVRDRLSGQVCRDLGVSPETLAFGVDAAWAMEPASPHVGAQVMANHGVPSDQGLLGISVRRWGFPGAADPAARQQLYRQRMATAIDRVVEDHGLVPVFVSTCNHPGYRFRDPDEAREVRRLLRRPADAYIVDPGSDPRAIQGTLGRLDALIATRFHALLLASRVQTPAMGIGYEPKTAEFLASESLDEYHLNMGDTSTEAWATAIDRFLANRDSLRAHWKTAAPDLRDRAYAQAGRLLDAVG